jgi:lipopolysaccharide export system protein LptA
VWIWLALLGLLSVWLAPLHAQSQPKKAPSKSEKPASLKAPASDGKPQPLVINADRMETLKKEGLIIFQGRVEARHNNNTQYADQMEVYLDDRGEKVLRSISTGNVKIIATNCRTGTARRAEYYDDEQKIILIGNARVWQDENVVQGERITMFLAEDRSVVEGGPQSRVNVTFYPSQSEQAKGPAAPKPRCQ